MPLLTLDPMPIIPTLVFVVVVLLFSVIAGTLWGSDRSLVDYFVMRKELRARQLGAAFVAADMSVATVMLALGLVGYVFGFWAAVWITVCWVVGIWYFVHCISKPILHEHIKRGHTLHELIGSHYDPDSKSYVRIVASFVTIIVFLFTIGIEFFAGYVVFDRLPGLRSIPFMPSPLVISVTIAFIVIIYTVRGGFRGAMRINIFRLVLVLFSFIIMLGLAIHFQRNHFLGSTSATSAIVGLAAFWRLDPIWLCATALTLIPAQLAAMDMWQRCAAAGGDLIKIRRGLYRSMPLYLVWLAPPYVGALAKVAGITDPNQNYIVLAAIEQMRPLGSGLWIWFLQPLLYGGLVATISCTTDTLLNAVAFTFMYDIYPALRRVDPDSLGPKQQRDLVSASKLWTAIAGLSAILVIFMGLFIATVYDLVAALFAVQILLFWPVFFVMIGHGKRDLSRQPRYALLGLVGGFLAAMLVLIFAIIMGDRTIMSAAPLGASFVAFICFGLLYLRSPIIRAAAHGVVQTR